MPRSSHREAATQIVRTLRGNGFAAFFAGGCVRDELLGLHPEDYDVATSARPDDIRRLFRHTNEVGASFGVMLVRTGRITVEVATFREEGPYSDKRRPDHVRFSDPPADARRRDFTINALFLDPEPDSTPAGPPAALEDVTTPEGGGRVIDYVGGLADLRSGLVRAVGDPDDRLAEDHLRALRAVRFTARLGFRLDEATAEAIRRHASELAGVSRERIGQEVRRMLEAPTRVAAAAVMARLGLVEVTTGRSAPAPGGGEPWATLAALPAESGFEVAMAAWELDLIGGGADPAPVDRIAAMADEVVLRARRALCLTNDERDGLRGILHGVVLLERDWQGAATAARKRAAAGAWFESALMIVRARQPAAAERILRDVAELSASPSGLAPAPLLTGDDLIAAGVRPGPDIGRVLERVYDAQLEDRMATRDDAMALAKSMLEAGQTANPRRKP